MINELVELLGVYEPIVINGEGFVNYGQVAAYALIIVSVWSVFRIIGKVISK